MIKSFTILQFALFERMPASHKRIQMSSLLNVLMLTPDPILQVAQAALLIPQLIKTKNKENSDLSFGHGIMGTGIPNKFSYLWPQRTANTLPMTTPGRLIQFLLGDWSAEIS